MELKDVLDRLEQSAEFKKWRESAGSSFLAHAFVLLDDANKDAWQMGYYNPESDTITTFIVSGKGVESIENQEILKTEQKIEVLKPELVTFEHEKALKAADEFHQLHHPREAVLKKFFIVQQMGEKAVYNITYFFQSMKTLNIKMDASTGEIISNNIQTLMEFDRNR